jgi:AcrR family transcriptional regulator
MNLSMNRRPPKGKGTRSYDATARRERARQQHDTTLDRARDLFLERGYVATTVESIASAAGISAATVYKTYGGKAGLVRELCARALLGAGPVPAEERSDGLRVGDDPRAVIEAWGALTTEVSPRISPLLLLLRTAAETDPDAADLLTELDEARLARMTENAGYLVQGEHLKVGVTAEEARDVLWLASSPELYELLVRKRGWTEERFGAFAAEMMASTLLEEA